MVLSQRLLADSKITPVTVVKPKDMVNRFLEEVRHRSEEAVKDDCPLLLMVFCHGLPNYKFLLSANDNRKGLTAVCLKEAIAHRCRVTLLSTACHSGGWVATSTRDLAHDPLNATMMAAANQYTESNAWHITHSPRRRTCGSIFTSSVIDALTSATDPLAPGDLQPDSPTEDQVLTYNSFCQSIVDHCRDGVHRLWDQQYFTFSAQDDQWDWTWDGRTGILLHYFRDRWNQLENVSYSGDLETKTASDPHPSNTEVSPAWLSSQTGGVTRQTRLRHSMTDSMINNRVTMMAQLFLETCPGDWTRGWGVGLRTMLAQAVERRIEDRDRAHPEIDISAFINYRWELAEMADLLVREYKLPVPNRESCIMWHDAEWTAAECSEIIGYKMRFGRVWDHFIARNFTPDPTQTQGPPFIRFTRYMTASVALAQLSDEETDRLVGKLIEYMDRFKEFYKTINAADEGNITKRREWMNSIGR